MNWLQIGCPFCPSEMNVPASMADAEVRCNGCGKRYVVPVPRTPVSAAASPLEPLSILHSPGLAGNSARGISPIPKLPAPSVKLPADRPGEANLSHVADAVRGGGDNLHGVAPFPWEMSPEARASAAAIFGAEPASAPNESELDEAIRRLRREQIRAYFRWMVVGLGMLAMIALAAFFILRSPG